VLSVALGVGHPVKPLPDVRRADARSAQIGSPAGISQCFQISAYSGEPFTPILARNLLSKDRCRLALGDEALKSGPEVSFVGMALSASCARNRLTRAASGPDGAAVAPSGLAHGNAPSSDTSEKVALGEAEQVAGLDILDAPIIHNAVRYVPSGNEIPQPLGSKRIILVIVGSHQNGTSSSKRVLPPGR
jgi:hypothetical protein